MLGRRFQTARFRAHSRAILKSSRGRNLETDSSQSTPHSTMHVEMRSFASLGGVPVSGLLCLYDVWKRGLASSAQPRRRGGSGGLAARRDLLRACCDGKVETRAAETTAALQPGSSEQAPVTPSTVLSPCPPLFPSSVFCASAPFVRCLCRIRRVEPGRCVESAPLWWLCWSKLAICCVAQSAFWGRHRSAAQGGGANLLRASLPKSGRLWPGSTQAARPRPGFGAMSMGRWPAASSALELAGQRTPPASEVGIVTTFFRNRGYGFVSREGVLAGRCVRETPTHRRQ